MKKIIITKKTVENILSMFGMAIGAVIGFVLVKWNVGVIVTWTVLAIGSVIVLAVIYAVGIVVLALTKQLEIVESEDEEL